MAYTGAMKDEGRCKIDWKAWNTAMDFVANQSTKLKLMSNVEQQRQYNKLDKEANPWLKMNPTDEDFDKYFEIINKQILVPSFLSFSITAVELETGCTAVIAAEAKAILKPSAMISTGASVLYPVFSIWSNTWKIKSSYQSFSKLAIETSERIMKEFVNDWTASQTLP